MNERAESRTLSSVIDELTGIFRSSAVDSPRLSARLLAAHATGILPEETVLHALRPLSPAEVEQAFALARRRAAGEPVAYILGRREFYGLPFRVGPGVLIPRPETEFLIELALEQFPADAPLRGADFGTGSGVLAVTLAVRFPKSHIVGLDVSRRALYVALANARDHGVESRVALVRGDLARPPLQPGSLDVVVANPPYVSRGEFATLSREVSGFEPRRALVAGETGKELLAVAARSSIAALAPGGMFCMEFGWTQGGEALRAVREVGFARAAVLRDMAGKPRVVQAFKAQGT